MKPTLMESLIIWMIKHPGYAETALGAVLCLCLLLLLDLFIPVKTFTNHDDPTHSR